MAKRRIDPTKIDRFVQVFGGPAKPKSKVEKLKEFKAGLEFNIAKGNPLTPQDSSAARQFGFLNEPNKERFPIPIPGKQDTLYFDRDHPAQIVTAMRAFGMLPEQASSTSPSKRLREMVADAKLRIILNKGTNADRALLERYNSITGGTKKTDDWQEKVDKLASIDARLQEYIPAKEPSEEIEGGFVQQKTAEGEDVYTPKYQGPAYEALKKKRERLAKDIARDAEVERIRGLGHNITREQYDNYLSQGKSLVTKTLKAYLKKINKDTPDEERQAIYNEAMQEAERLLNEHKIPFDVEYIRQFE